MTRFITDWSHCYLEGYERGIPLYFVNSLTNFFSYRNLITSTHSL